MANNAFETDECTQHKRTPLSSKQECFSYYANEGYSTVCSRDVTVSLLSDCLGTDYSKSGWTTKTMSLKPINVPNTKGHLAISRYTCTLLANYQPSDATSSYTRSATFDQARSFPVKPEVLSQVTNYLIKSIPQGNFRTCIKSLTAGKENVQFDAHFVHL